MSNQGYEQGEQERQGEQDTFADQQSAGARQADLGGLREDLSVDISDVSEGRGRATIGEREGTLIGRRVPGDAGRPIQPPTPAGPRSGSGTNAGVPADEMDQGPGRTGGDMGMQGDQPGGEFGRSVMPTDDEQMRGVGQGSGGYGETPGGAYSDLGQNEGGAGRGEGNLVGPLSPGDEEPESGIGLFPDDQDQR
jgi:hypothetical protein